MSAAGPLRILCWNLNSIRSFHRNGHLAKVFSPVPPLNFDILCFQETKFGMNDCTSEFALIDGYDAFFSFHAKPGYAGVVTYTRRSAPPVAAWEGFGPGQPSAGLEGRAVTTDHGSFLLINIYTPNGGANQERLPEKLEFLERLSAACAAHVASGRSVVIAGDFNVAHGPDDLGPRLLEKATLGRLTGYLREERAWFDAALSSGFTDTWRKRNPGLVRFTHDEGWRLDYFLVNTSLDAAVASVRIADRGEHPVFRASDHSPIILELHHHHPHHQQKPADPSQPGQPADPSQLKPARQWAKFTNAAKQSSIASFFGKRPSHQGDTAPEAKKLKN
jgi:exodeoxyribonuclease-3